MRILLINQVFYPDVAATAQHAHDLALHLIKHGHEVEVIASRSIYWKGGSSGGAGELLPKREVVDGIEINRVGRSVFGKSNNLARAADFGLFYLAAMLKAFLVKQPDVVVCFTTPPLIALVGWMLRAIRGSRFVYWVMDLYPDLPVACGVMRKTSLIARVCERIHRFVLRRADRIVVLGRCMRSRVLEKGISNDAIEIVHVWSDTEEVKLIPREANPYRAEWGVGDAFVVMYSGNYGVGHDVQTMLGAALRLRDRNDIQFVFAGGGVRKKEVEGFITEHALKNAQSRPYQPRERLAELLTLADLHLASQAQSMAGLFVPSKLFGILAAARPAVFVGNADAENALVLEENNCGWVIPCGDIDGLVALIEKLAADRTLARETGERGRAALAAHYSREDGCERWRRLLERVAANPAS